MMRILIAGGGTGGHIYPGIAVAEEITRRGGEAVFAGAAAGLETRIVPLAGFELRLVRAAPILRGRPFQNLVAMAHLAAGLDDARRLLRDLRPDAVLGMGGWVSAPTCLAARLAGIPVAIHEQNAAPGLANRLIARFASLVMTSWPDSAGGLVPGRAVRVGLPVRAAFASIDRATARRRLGVVEAARLVVVFGGSRGAASINRAVAAAAGRFADAGLTLLWATGEAHYAVLREELGPETPRLTLVPYLEEMPAALRAADLAVTRAGAMTLAELAASGAPAILAPYPHATGDHQTANARAHAVSGAAEMICDAELSARLYDLVVELMAAPERLARMAAASLALARPRAAAEIVDRLEKMMNEEK
jgi:UDP-N-acetylglucosamine--N-acetylmuramyl-(pentapeptide) pyrophosphoryl-undecaprenol N-acetylglucosamine transferase